jgi:hypothetical protein
MAKGGHLSPLSPPPILWWHTLLWGFAAIGAAAAVYLWLDYEERTGGEFKLPWYLAIIYNGVGKWGISSVFLIMAGGLFIASARQRHRS